VTKFDFLHAKNYVLLSRKEGHLVNFFLKSVVSVKGGCFD